MPLLILTAPKQTGVNAEALAETGNLILDEVVGIAAKKEGILGIPDKTDRELRIVVSSKINRPTAVLSFTIGPNEYPGSKSPAFFPREEKKRQAGEKIKQLVEEVGLRGVGVSMEAWENTTFKLREEEPKELQPHGLTTEQVREIGKGVKEPKIRLVLSPDMIEEAGGSKEAEQGRRIEFYNQVTQEMARLMAKTLGIPEQTELAADVLVADHADSNISVEFDCQPKGLIPEVLREHGAGRLEQLLNEKLPKGGAEIWIRQGEPQVTTISYSP